MKNREALGWLIAAALFVAVAAAYWPRGELISGTARVIDGDGLRVGSTEVRLHAVDAFEAWQAYVDEEDEAREARRGAWAGEFTAPWDARRGRDTQSEQPPR